MNFIRVNDEVIEIIPEDRLPEEVLEAVARLSYELAESPAPFFMQPFDVPAESVDFASMVQEGELRMDYLNGRLCSTHVSRVEDRLYFDAARFLEDRGSPEAFLTMVRVRLGQGGEAGI
jgi:hypothetical protein